MKPNKAHLRLWVKALRSGRYRQGEGVLKDGEGKYCCLGVACNVFKRETKRGVWTATRAFFVSDKEGGSGSLLPVGVSKWLGVQDENPTVKDSSAEKHCLTYLNDHAQYTFPEIADAIERTYNL